MTGIPWFTWFTNFRIHKKSCAMSLNIYKCKLVFMFSQLWICLIGPKDALLPFVMLQCLFSTIFEQFSL